MDKSLQKFLPRDKLDEVLTEERVISTLRDEGGFSPQRQLDIAKQILNPIANTTSTQPHLQSRKEIFAILACIEKVQTIEDFIKEDIYDYHLPFSYVRNAYPPSHERRHVMMTSDLDREAQEVELFRTWRPYAAESFEDRQWRIHVPVFSSIREEDGKPTHYAFAHNAARPYISRREVGRGGFSAVDKVELHAGHIVSSDKAPQKTVFAIKRLETPSKLERKRHGRHGDLKPENILWFRDFNSSEKGYSLGTLKISDFGLTKFHGTHSRSRINTEGLGGSPTYRAPEYDVHNEVSQSYDIWSLACVLLEFATWYLEGWEEVENFSKLRKDEDRNPVMGEDTFFNHIQTSSTISAKAKRSVAYEVQSLYEHANGSDFTIELLQLIENGLLRMRPDLRKKCCEIYQHFKKFFDDCCQYPDYCLKRVKTPPSRKNTELSLLGPVEIHRPFPSPKMRFDDGFHTRRGSGSQPGSPSPLRNSCGFEERLVEEPGQLELGEVTSSSVAQIDSQENDTREPRGLTEEDSYFPPMNDSNTTQTSVEHTATSIITRQANDQEQDGQRLTVPHEQSGETSSQTESNLDVEYNQPQKAQGGVASHDEIVQPEHVDDKSWLKHFHAVKQHPRAFWWAAFAAFQVLLVSYENQASGIVIGIPQFRKDFGSAHAGNYVLDAGWQASFSAAPVATQVIGALGSGQLADVIGRKRTIMVALVISLAAIAMEIAATTNEMFFAGKLVNGIAVGTLKAVSTTYIGDVIPTALRGLLTCLIGLSYTIGPFIVALIVQGTGSLTNRWAYRSVFISQYGVIAVSVSLVWFMPESPWWLALKGRDEDALQSLRRLGHVQGREDVALADIKTTMALIQQETEGVTYLECFRKSNLRRTMISIAPLLIQALVGSLFTASYSTYYAQLAGFSTAMSFRLQITQQVLSMVGNVVSWFLIDRIGRRSLMLWGTASLCVSLWIMAGLAVDGKPVSLKGAVSIILVYSFLYNVSIGAAAFTILAETSTSRLRMKTVSIGLACQSSVNLAWSFALPYLFNPDHLNLGGKVGFIFGGTSILCWIYLWFCQTETRGRSYAELDEMFMKKVPARKFNEYQTETENIRVKEES
ncbi:general substrate transporter [Fusarium austroafricanum]|uniref:General substrate transporter n=1 Tax=Fusarium austroafricanum TaxID=2364996 RepID=A0A8H4KUX2_9HYPO|nr:general substrate transporter [Fusarium austroafricanum]